MENLFKLFDWVTLIIVAVVTSVIVEALNSVTPKWLGPRTLLFLVACFITLLKTPIVLGNIPEWQSFLFNVFFTMCFAIIFYTYLGKFTVGKIFEKLKSKFGSDAEVYMK